MEVEQSGGFNRYSTNQSSYTNKAWFTRIFVQLPSLPQLMGNGVSEEGPMVQAKNWRHSVAEGVSEPYAIV